MPIFADGHVHTPFCPHGSDDAFNRYIERAIALGLREITFTEHAPLPAGFEDPVPEKDSGMAPDKLEAYLKTIEALKEEYSDDISIHTGLEIDFIKGFESETQHFLDQYGPHLDDGILSVHFLKLDDNYYCLDYSPSEFGRMVEAFGSIDRIYEDYFHTVHQSIITDLGKHKPSRIGHMTLASKFQKKFRPTKSHRNEIIRILDAVQKQGYQLDYNGAGVVKELCGEPYPPEWAVKEAIARHIPLVYGSDAHTAAGLGQGASSLFKDAKLSSPYASSLSTGR